jgi:AraC-like DNA-binding protein
MTKVKENFKKQLLKNHILINGVYTIHYFKYGKNFKYPKEKHNFFELVYIDSGNAIIIAENSTFELKQGQAFLHKPNDLHTIYTNNDFANSAIITFECKSKDVYSICGQVLDFNNEQKSLLNKIINEAKSSFSDPLDDLELKRMNKRSSAPYAGEQIIKNCIELLIISALRNTYQHKNVHSPLVKGPYNPLVVEIMRYLDTKLDNAEHITLEDLSIKTGFSKSYIKTKFKQELNKSIVQFFIDMKIEKAKKLLCQENKTVNEISYELGFNSVQYFCRQFKMRTNMSPSTYANSIKTDNLL